LSASVLPPEDPVKESEGACFGLAEAGFFVFGDAAA